MTITATMNTCACGKPAADAFLCRDCADEITQALAETPFLAQQTQLRHHPANRLRPPHRRR